VPQLSQRSYGGCAFAAGANAVAAKVSNIRATDLIELDTVFLRGFGGFSMHALIK
jgi:hypothetical protein